MAQSVEHCSLHQKVAGSMTGQGTCPHCRFDLQTTNRCFSLNKVNSIVWFTCFSFLFPSLSLFLGLCNQFWYLARRTVCGQWCNLLPERSYPVLCRQLEEGQFTSIQWGTKWASVYFWFFSENQVSQMRSWILILNNNVLLLPLLNFVFVSLGLSDCYKLYLLFRLY